ncbi:MAG: hypothetical protein AAF217_14915 [Pseudomonadota bacterium]
MNLKLEHLLHSKCRVFNAKKKGKINFFGSLFTTIFLLNFWIASAQAEGSKELVQYGGDRPFMDWSESKKTAGIERKTFLKVFVKAGETIYLGSSVHNSPGNTDIILRTPLGSVQTFDVQSNGARQGYIDTVAKELAGPLSASNPNGYNPHTFTATTSAEEGIYEVEFRSTNDSSDPTARSTTASFTSNQNISVGAWDITVKDSSETIKNGRVFTNYVALNMGGSSRKLNSEFFIQTKDGFLYRTKMNELDPFGFLFFGNSRGFLDYGNDNIPTTLYRSAKAGNNDLNPFQGNVRVQRPDVPDTLTDITHRVFFNRPDPDTLIALGIPTVATPPPQPSNFEFTGAASGNQTYVGAGGNFSFSTTDKGSYEIIIDTDTDGVYDPSKDRILQDVTTGGSEVVTWDGKDANGVDLPRRPNNAPYNARIRLRTGEYHFPMLDAESNPKGFVIEMLNPPNLPAEFSPFTIYYNDENYTTRNGTLVSLDESGEPRTPGTPSNPRNASTGINSSLGEHKFSNSYGDFLGIDTWAYFPSDASFAQVIITLGNVSGTLYQDNDGEDDFDSGEPRLPKDITLRLYNDANGNNVIDPGEEIATTVTDDNGDYIFDEVPDGDYKIKVDINDSEIPSGITLGTPNDLPVTVTGSAVTDNNFGFDRVVANNPLLLLVKRITAINGQNINPNDNTLLNTIVNDTTSPRQNDDDNPNWPNSYLIGAIDGGKVKPGDEIEYTVYFLSSGESPARNVLFCDRVPGKVSFIPNSFSSESKSSISSPTGAGIVQNTDRGILWEYEGRRESLSNLRDGDLGEYFPPNIEPDTFYSGIDCDGDPNVNISNTNGAVVVNLRDLPNATGSGTPRRS